MTPTERLAHANQVLRLYAPCVTLERTPQGRLWLSYTDGRWTCRKAAVLNRDGSSLACRYGAIGMGGTCAGATAQLIRWVRGLSRLPLDTWEYWTSRAVLLGGIHAVEIVPLLRASDYHDPTKTGCVLCKAERIGDWWSLDGVQGPCCGWNTGCRQQVQRKAA